jgi:hypothetical protein
METFRNLGMVFICAYCIERTSVGNTECSIVSVHSVVLVQCISDCVEWQSMWEKSENERLVRIWKRADRWCSFTLSICDKNCHIIRWIESDSFYGYVSAITNHGKTTSAKKNSGRKSTLTERVVVHWGLFRKITHFLHHWWQQNWRFYFHKNCPTWVSQIQQPG